MTTSTFLILCFYHIFSYKLSKYLSLNPQTALKNHTDLFMAHIDCRLNSKTLMQLVAAGHLDWVTGPSPYRNETCSGAIVLKEQQ